MDISSESSDIGLKVLVAGKVSPSLSVFLLNIPGAIFISGSLRRFAIAGPYGKFCSWSDLFTYVFYSNA